MGWRGSVSRGTKRVRALEIIRGHTDADDPVGYRSDDREGCLDAVHAEAGRALAYIAALARTPEPREAQARVEALLLREVMEYAHRLPGSLAHRIAAALNPEPEA